MSNKTQPPEAEVIDRIAMIIDSMRDVPDGFADSFRDWAEDLSHGNSYKSPAAYREWDMEIRPYSISELARKLQGVAGRTTLHKVLKEIPIAPEKGKTVSGKLTPEVVRMILDRLTESRSNKKLEK